MPVWVHPRLHMIQKHVRLIGDSKAAVGGDVSVNVCLGMYPASETESALYIISLYCTTILERNPHKQITPVQASTW